MFLSWGSAFRIAVALAVVWLVIVFVLENFTDIQVFDVEPPGKH